MSEAPRRVLLVGATGLVGRRVIARGRLLPGLALTALVRREMELPRGGWASEVAAPVEDWPARIGAIAPDAVICALGTTQKKAGPAGLVLVDRELVLAVARAAKLAGARHFVAVSSVGADATSGNHYLRTKGETENALDMLGFARLDLLRPGLLLGARWHDSRPLERLGQMLTPLTNSLLHGRWMRYRSVDAGVVAAAALQAVRGGGEGRHIHEYESLCELAARLPVVRA
jgi:uncharacterized protein YbjT (DUF2867 family)